MIKRFLIFLILFVLSFFTFLIKTNRVPNFFDNENIYKVIKSEFGDQYEVNIVEDNVRGYGKATIVVFANDQRYKDQANVPIDNPEELERFKLSKLLHPIIAFYEYRGNPFTKLLLFTVPYRKIYEFKPEVNNDDNDHLWIYRTNIVDLDGDGKKEVINMSDNIKHTLNISDTDHYIEFVDLDKDDSYELIFAHPEWRISKACFGGGKRGKSIDCECHFCPHYWAIGVYKYIGGNFVIDNKWNDGLLYKTPSKISLTSALGYKELPNNITGVIGPYYLEKASPYSNMGIYGFYTNSQIGSSIYKIVQVKYNK